MKLRTVVLGILAASELVNQAKSGEARVVEYDIEGSAKYADVTWTDKSGSTEQKRVKFPVHESFVAQVGTLAYVSAQKVRVVGEQRWMNSPPDVLADGVHGEVHVMIRVSGKLVGEATADAPFGIAKASAKVD